MRWLVTGGVGFIGTNLVDHLMQQGHDVVVLDDMSRGGVEANAAFLADRCGRAPLHSLWHLLVSYTCLRCCVLALHLHVAGAQPQL